jgi:hypothetical protein
MWLSRAVCPRLIRLKRLAEEEIPQLVTAVI